MGILHAVYGTRGLTRCLALMLTIYWVAGLGAFAAPLVATQFAQMDRWSFHYLTSLGLAVCNTIILAVVFRFRDQDSESDSSFLVT